ncbi:putative Mg2+ transporter-C (MgtC) family protein [Laceyella tengchongensis]|jgi:putative Mg2+ transporter-C (MgtC) family protein|uniref:Mg2+ transporter-C (MgtC) family protein n=2 Tax=Laceyella tengchongensis TaxID=574699 RepID=A0AA45WRJ1_9BACL|nr:MgtC/SapB family protein [Laceyella tengchongensis]SMP30550.1 putative Mg2+ transporter-C (MgtC) family protein [Laceyella tengchongensis]
MGQLWVIPYWDIAWRLFMAGLLGGLVGWERERHNHPAGFRTHILVSLGSALIMLISIYGFTDYMDEEQVRFDPARLSAQVVSGIGFLGAGTILRHRASVSGLTTAASLWVVSGVGLAVGAGFMFGAVLTTVFALVSLELLTRMEKILIRKRHLCLLHIHVKDEQGKLGQLFTLISEKGGSVRKVNVEEDEEMPGMLEIALTVRLPQKTTLTELIDEITNIEGVKSVRAD